MRTAGAGDRNKSHRVSKQFAIWGAVFFFGFQLFLEFKEVGAGNDVQTPGGRLAVQRTDPIIQVDLRRIRIGEEVTKVMGVFATATVQIARSPIVDGISTTWICAKAIEPAVVLEHPKAPSEYLVVIDPHVGYIHDMSLSDVMKRFLAESGITKVDVVFTIAPGKLGEVTDCTKFL